MRHSSRLAALLLMAPLGACASASPRTSLQSAVELRALQTRSYEKTASKAVLQALVDTMQDEGFRISRAEPELGLIVAEKESVSRPSAAKQAIRAYLIIASYGAAALLPWQKFHHSVLEATAQVSEVDGGARVRFGLQLRALDKGGHLKNAQAIDDPALYQALFARLDKSLYLQREGID